MKKKIHHIKGIYAAQSVANYTWRSSIYSNLPLSLGPTLVEKRRSLSIMNAQSPSMTKFVI